MGISISITGLYIINIIIIHLAIHLIIVIFYYQNYHIIVIMIIHNIIITLLSELSYYLIIYCYCYCHYNNNKHNNNNIYIYSDAHVVGGFPSEPTEQVLRQNKSAEVASMARHAPEVRADFAGDVISNVYIIKYNIYKI